jgi:hypothetical protein
MFLIAGPVQSPCLFMSISPILAQHAGVVSIFDFGVDGSEPRVRCYDFWFIPPVAVRAG